MNELKENDNIAAKRSDRGTSVLMKIIASDGATMGTHGGAHSDQQMG